MTAELHVVGAAILRDNRCLVAQRSADMALPLKWEFPGGKVRSDESPEAALLREIREELGIEIEVREFLADGRIAQGEHQIWLQVFLAELTGGTLELLEHAQIRWARPDELRTFDWAEADLPAVRALEEWFDKA